MKNYFSHDYNARNDKKLARAFMLHGLKAIGAYWCVVEMLNEEGGYLPLAEYERITFELRTDKKVIRYLIFDSELFLNDGLIFWSESGISRMKLWADKSAKARKSINVRWDKIKSDTNVLQTNTECTTIVEKKAPIEKSEVPIFNFSNSLFELGVEKQIISDWLKVRKNKKGSNTLTAFKSIKKNIDLSGISANECIKLAVEKNWCGFESKWIKNNFQNGESKRSGSTTKTVDANNKQVFC